MSTKVELKKEAYRDGIKRKGDKIGMGYMKYVYLSMLTPSTPSHNPYYAFVSSFIFMSATVSKFEERRVPVAI